MFGLGKNLHHPSPAILALQLSPVPNGFIHLANCPSAILDRAQLSSSFLLFARLSSVSLQHRRIYRSKTQAPSSMRAITLLSPLWLLTGSLVVANYDSRGPEVEYYFRAYRMDVDISVAEFLKDPANAGKDPNVEKPWALGKHLTTANEDADWPNGGRPKQEYGLNFHAWMKGVDSEGRYGRNAARARPGMSDPFDPDFKAAFADIKKMEKDHNGNDVAVTETRNNIMRLPLDSAMTLDTMDKYGKFVNDNSQNKYSFSKFDAVQLFGTLNKWEKGKPLGKYFTFDNMFAIVAKRCADLYERNPEIGKPHYTKMTKALKQAQHARRMDSRAYQLEVTQKVLKDYEISQKLNSGTVNQPGILKTRGKLTSADSEGSWFPGDPWKTQELDIEKTKKDWPKSLAKHKEALFGNNEKDPAKKTVGKIGEFAERWAKGDLTFIDKKGELKPEKGMASNYEHLQVIRAEERLEKSMKAQMKDPNGSKGAAKCEWFDPKGPGDGGIDPLKRRLADMEEAIALAQ